MRWTRREQRDEGVEVSAARDWAMSVRYSNGRLYHELSTGWTGTGDDQEKLSAVGLLAEFGEWLRRNVGTPTS